MPFSLAYRCEAIVPVKLSIGSLIRDNFDGEQNMIYNDTSLIFSKKNGATRNFGWHPYNLIFQLEGEDEEISRRRPRCRRVLQNKGALDPSWEGLYQLAHLNGDGILRLWNAEY